MARSASGSSTIMTLALLAAAATLVAGPRSRRRRQEPCPPLTASVAVDPDQAGASPHWTITIPAEYCGGYRVGDGVYISPESPIMLPLNLPDGSALYAGQPGDRHVRANPTGRVNQVVRIAPAPGLAQSMLCAPGDRALTVELLPQAGMSSRMPRVPTRSTSGQAPIRPSWPCALTSRMLSFQPHREIGGNNTDSSFGASCSWAGLWPG